AVRQADVQTVMTSANGMNFEFVSDSRKMLTDILKHRWGFEGFVMTDWLQTRSTEKAAFAGLDVSMPGGDRCGFGTALLEAVKAGRVPVEVIDDKVRRILRVYDYIGILDREDRSAGAEISTPEHHRTALEIAEQGIVLLKNEAGALPLNEKRLRNVLVIGPNADKRFCLGAMGGSSWMESTYEVTVLQGIRRLLGEDKVTYISSDELGDFKPLTAEMSPEGAGFSARYFVRGSDEPALVRTEPKIDFMWEMKSPDPSIDVDEFSEARYELKFIPPVDGKYAFRFTAGGGIAYVYNNEWAGAPVTIAHPGKGEGTVTASLDLKKGAMLRLCVIWRKGTGAAALRVEWQSPQTELVSQQWKRIERAARKADAVVFVGGIDHSLDTEGRDRVSLTFPELQERLIVRLAELNRNTHVVLINGSPLEIGGWLPHVSSLVEAWYPGMEGGTAVANVLFGRVNPSGRMPFTWPRKLDDAPCRKFGYEDDGTVVYGEKLKVGYRYFDTAAVEPEFTFGYGLSYTTFEYDNLEIAGNGSAGVAGHVDVVNAGKMDGCETVQIYVRPVAPAVERPHHELKWFRKVFIPAGESVRVDFELGAEAFAYWDVRRGDWTVDAGVYEIEVCRDSRSVIASVRSK
ncbi:MAG: glycoside hydrolase family 3 C-terminal domain-containing protein, partial [Alistipes sp.]|nr:glycoside hydrolase family 3 C-terminal domain-containing protein [Alistipes sp.]